MGKLRLDYLLTKAELAFGDGYIEDGINGEITVQSQSEINAMISDPVGIVITSFAPRGNTGKQPCGDDLPLIWTNQNGDEYSTLSKSANWTHIYNQLEVSEWKLDLEALIKMQDEHDNKKAKDSDSKKATEKPVYTQAMKDAGELPSVGMECEMLFDVPTERWIKVKVEAIVGYAAMLSTSSKLPSDMSFSKGINELIDKHDMYFFTVDKNKQYRPIDTRTPKQKQVAEVAKFLDLCDVMKHSNKQKAFEMQKDGLLSDLDNEEEG